MSWNGEIAWRPRLRQIGWAPKGEEWRCWLPGLDANAGERWTTQVEMSLIERWHKAIGYGYGRDLEYAMRDCDVYEIMHVEDLFKVVLHLPKPLAEILDEIKIPRTKTIGHFRPLVGPMPEFHGPLEPSGLLPHGTSMGNDKELLVQPSFQHIPNLPIFDFKLPSPEGFKLGDPVDWTKTLRELVELQSINPKGLQK